MIKNLSLNNEFERKKVVINAVEGIRIGSLEEYLFYSKVTRAKDKKEFILFFSYNKKGSSSGEFRFKTLLNFEEAEKQFNKLEEFDIMKKIRNEEFTDHEVSIILYPEVSFDREIMYILDGRYKFCINEGRSSLRFHSF